MFLVPYLSCDGGLFTSISTLSCLACKHALLLMSWHVLVWPVSFPQALRSASCALQSSISQPCCFFACRFVNYNSPHEGHAGICTCRSLKLARMWDHHFFTHGFFNMPFITILGAGICTCRLMKLARMWEATTSGWWSVLLRQLLGSCWALAAQLPSKCWPTMMCQMGRLSSAFQSALGIVVIVTVNRCK